MEQETPIKDTEDNITDAVEDMPEAAETAPIEDTIETAEKESTQSQESELAALRGEAKKNLEGWQRTLAEFQNYKRRTEREQKDLSRKTTLDTIAKILPIMDDFERALASLPQEFEGNPWTNGISLIQGKFKKLLEEHDITIIEPTGEVFDPNRHQAIAMDDSDDYESGYVIETLQKGFASGDILLRPAMVRVAN